MKKFLLRCLHCGREYCPSEIEYTCPHCGDRLGTLEVIYDRGYLKKAVKRERFEKFSPKGIWQFEALLPVSENGWKPPLLVGNTPLYKSRKLSEKYGVGELFIKDDGRNPTASFKDRASAVAVARAVEKGYDTLFCASTGNAASSLSGLCAASGLKSYIFVPASAPVAKLTQLQVYGARVIPIDGSYDEAFDISMKVGFENNWYCRNSAINPYLLEGKKTGALEIAVQMNWALPDFVFVSVGDGTVLSSFHKGFLDLKEAGLIDEIPIIVGVQAEGADAIIRAYEKGEPFEPEDIEAFSVADSISVGKPRDFLKACVYTKRNKGLFVRVSDEDILNSIIELARATGVFAEPAGATAFAGFKKLHSQGRLSSSSRIVIVVTGNGLKDLKAPQKMLKPLKKVPANLDKVREAIGSDC
ncbi:threonine synthase [Kosmotoga arenicorallina S304]|uniref:Threonine synthase n=1 Tax=Kosmotoga arenicorallina S304 TaxID=1453497 RepID=A0A176JXK9_9BACT|nr:threonine synthase [Kosmotoga arenicorallina]OAA28440.1 threonine synthase [Kosmotoga arenicorallina S304]